MGIISLTLGCCMLTSDTRMLEGSLIWKYESRNEGENTIISPEHCFPFEKLATNDSVLDCANYLHTPGNGLKYQTK